MATFKVVHTINLVTEFNDKHPTVERMKKLPPEIVNTMLESMFKDIMTEHGIMNKLNEGHTYALLRFAENGETSDNYASISS